MPLPSEFFERARALVRADTVSARGNRAAADLLQPLYEEAGLAVHRQVVHEGIDGGPVVEQVNILAGPGGVGLPAGVLQAHESDAVRGPAGGLLLVTHLDTVPPGPPERWTETGGDPFALTEKDGVLFGLGAADVKLDALCKIEAARRLRGRRFARPFWLLGTFAEEVGLRGARHFAQSPLFQTLRPRQVLCGEPSELQLIHAHKGYAVVRCTVTDSRARLVSTAGPGIDELGFAGKAAHSSTPHLGVNAIHKALAWSRASHSLVIAARGGAAANVVPARCTLQIMAPRESAPGAAAPDDARSLPPGPPRPNLWRALQTCGALEELWLQEVRALLPALDGRFDPPGAVGGLNLIRSLDAPAPPRPGSAVSRAASLPENVQGSAGTAPAGTAPEDVYGSAVVEAIFDARLLPAHDPDALLARFAPLAQQWVARLGQGQLSLHIAVERNASGMALPDDSPLVHSVSAVLAARGLPAEPRAKPTSTEAGIFFRAGCEAIVIGPGRSTGNAHTANERIEVSQLEQAVELYEALIPRLCS